MNREKNLEINFFLTLFIPRFCNFGKKFIRKRVLTCQYHANRQFKILFSVLENLFLTLKMVYDVGCSQQGIKTKK
jgi:hypothetical protein